MTRPVNKAEAILLSDYRELTNPYHVLRSKARHWYRWHMAKVRRAWGKRLIREEYAAY